MLICQEFQPFELYPLALLAWLHQDAPLATGPAPSLGTPGCSWPLLLSHVRLLDQQ